MQIATEEGSIGLACAVPIREGVLPPLLDSDEDMIPDVADNCPEVANLNQEPDACNPVQVCE